MALRRRHETLEEELADLLLSERPGPWLALHARLCPSCRKRLRRLRIVDASLRAVARAEQRGEGASARKQHADPAPSRRRALRRA